MTEGVKLGGAYYQIDVAAAPALAALQQFQQQSQRSSQAVAAALGISEKAAQQLAATWIRSEQARANASAQSALKIIRAHNDAADAAEKSAKASQQSAVSFTAWTRSAIGFTAAAAGVTTGALAINQALTKVSETTQRATQLQFQLTQAYGTQAAQFTKLANDQAQASGQSNLAVQEGVARFGVLMRGYGLTNEQVVKLTKVTLDLAAATGTDTVDAFERMIGVFRDGGESAEKLGLVLNDQSIKAFANLSKEQRKNFEQMDALEKSQIRYTEAIKQGAASQGAAAQRANSQAGAWSQLQRAGEQLALTIGQGISAGGGNNLLSALTGATLRMAEFATRTLEAYEATSQLKAAGQGLTGGLIDVLLIPGAVQARIEQNRRLAAQGIQGPDPGMPGGTTGGLSDAAARAQIITNREREAREEETRQKKIAEVRKRARDLEAQAGIEAAEAEHDRAVRAVDERIRLAEVEKEGKLRALEASHKAALHDLEDEQRAAEQANKDAIERAERERDVQIKAAEAAKEQIVKAIDERREALKQEHEQEDRDRADAREHADRLLSDARETEDREREAAHTEVLRRIDDEHKSALQAIEGEADAARKASDERLRRLDQADRREDDRHRRAVQRIDDERDAELDKLDIQLKALDVQERAERSAHRTADLQKKVADAQKAALLAKGTGTPADIAAARGDLTQAIRGGNEIAITNARQRLVQLAGQGAEAIKKADEDLASAQQDLQDEVADSARDAEREKLKATQDRIKQEADSDKRAEDDRNRRRKRDLDDSKDAERQKLKSTLDRLDRQKDAESKAHDQRVRQDKDEYDRNSQLLRDKRRDEDRALQDRRQSEDRDRADRREKEDAELEHRRKAADEALEKDREAIKEHYEGPNGVLTLLKKQTDNIRLEYQQRSRDLEAVYEHDKETVADFYRNAAQTGVLDKLDAEKKYLDQTLNDEKARWEQHRKDLTGPDGEYTKTINEMRAQFDRLLGHFQENGGVPLSPGGQITVPGSTGGGNDGGGPGPRVGEGADQVPDPYEVQFPFGARYSNPFNAGIPVHRGVDVVVKGAPNGGKGSPVQAFENGEVKYRGWDENGGNGVSILGEDGLYHRYFHLDQPARLGVGDKVKRGDIIGTLGETGTEGSPHLHYEVSKNPGGDSVGDLIDPVPYMNAPGGRVADTRVFEFTLFGHTFRIRLPKDGAEAWIRAAMRQEDTDGDWLDGLLSLLELENPRHDPKAENPIEVITEDGTSLGHARGLLQMLRGTFRAYRDHDLPNDIDNPVANAAASIRYIRDTYGHVDRIPNLHDRSQFQGYREGGWITEPIVGMGASGQGYIFGEAGPELVTPASRIDRRPLIGPAPVTNYAAMGAFMASAHPSVSGGWRGESVSSYVEGDVIFNGLTYDQAERRQRREQKRRSLLHGVAGRVR